MKCLSVRQPWAWLIVVGFKPVENRTWPTAVRGEVLIHAAKGCTAREYADARHFITESEHANIATRASALCFPPLAILDRGAIIGKATLVDCVTDHPSPYFVGPYGHVFTNVKRCHPFPYKGALSYFHVPDDIVSQLEWM